MNTIWFDGPLDTAASWWRLARKDGVTMGFTSHDRPLWFAGLLHEAAPGMLPAALRMTGDFAADIAEIAGSLTADGITEVDLAAGRWDGAAASFGLVDWTRTDRRSTLYRGTIGKVRQSGSQFSVELASRKASLTTELLPRSAPSCRAQFCGPQCGLSAARFSHLAQVIALAGEDGVFALQPGSGPADPSAFRFGALIWTDGANAGLQSMIDAGTASGAAVQLRLAGHPAFPLAIGDRCRLLEGCDRSYATCGARFANRINFRGEPHLPGNDLLTRTPLA